MTLLGLASFVILTHVEVQTVCFLLNIVYFSSTTVLFYSLLSFCLSLYDHTMTILVMLLDLLLPDIEIYV